MSEEHEETGNIFQKSSYRPQFQRTLIVVTIPILFSFLLFFHRIHTPDDFEYGRFAVQLRWGYVAVVVGAFWMTNIFPLAAVAFIPVIFLPLFGISQSKQLSEKFMSNSNAATLGLIIVVVALDGCELRRRISLALLERTGGCIHRTFIYIFVLTLWLSMWIHCAPATYVMMKIVDDVVEHLKSEVSNGALGEHRVAIWEKIIESKSISISEVSAPVAAVEEEVLQPAPAPDGDAPTEQVETTKITREDISPVLEPVAKFNIEEAEAKFNGDNDKLLQEFGGELLYAIGVAANIGGNFWPFGSPLGAEILRKEDVKNQVFDENYRDFRFQRQVLGYSEASWMIYSLPLVLLNSLIALGWLLWVNFSNSNLTRIIIRPKWQRLCNSKQKKSSIRKMKESFSSKREQLGPWSFQEKAIVLLLFLWIPLAFTRFPLFMPSFPSLLPTTSHKDVGDSLISIFLVFLLFLIPKIGLGLCNGPQSSAEKPSTQALLGWKYMQGNFPWAVQALIGASRTLGRSSEKIIGGPVGVYIAKFVHSDSTKDIVLLRVVFMILLTICNTFISNTGSVIVTIQIWRSYAKHLAKEYNYVLNEGHILPAFSVASLCFVLPNSSVPTAMVYRYRKKKTLSAWYFLRVGIPLFVFTLVTTSIYALLWAPHSLTHDG